MIVRRRTRGAAALVAAAIAVAALSASAPAVAADGDGLWYYDLFNLKTAHDAGFTGEGVTIAVLDGAINPDALSLAGTSLDVQPALCYDEAGTRLPVITDGQDAMHGTHVVSLLAGANNSVAPDAHIIFFNVLGPTDENGNNPCFAPDGKGSETASPAAFLGAIEAGADIISVSAGLEDTPEMVKAIALAQSKGIVIVGGVPNVQEFDGVFVGTYPYAANGVVGVQSIDVNATVAGPDGTSNKDAYTDVIAPGVDILVHGIKAGEGVDWDATGLGGGTSLATPITAGMLALVKQKYPAATGNQLIQTLIRNTGAEDHELSYDGSFLTGYGVVSASHMLEKDPTLYDDSNPLLSDDPELLPTREMVLNPESLDEWLDSVYGVAADPQESDDPQSPEDAGTGFPLWLLLVLLGGGLVIVVGVVVLIIVLASRKSTSSTPHEGVHQ